MSAHAAIEKVLAELDDAGVGTYCIVLQDHDSRSELVAIKGSKPWLYGQMLLKADEIKVAYNAETTRAAFGLDGQT